MRIQKSIGLALNIIIHSKLRSWLTILGIVIGVAAIIAIVSIGSGFEKDVQKQLGSLGSDTITITPGFDRANECPGPHCRDRPGEVNSISTNLFTNKEIQVLKSITDILLVNPVINGKSEVYFLGETANLDTDGVDTRTWRDMTTSTAENGRLLNPGDKNVVIIGSSVAKDIFNEEVKLNRKIIINDKPFNVVGILKQSGGFGFDDRKIFMSSGDAKEILEKEEGEFDSIVVKVKDQNKIDEVEKKIEQKLMVVRHVTEETKDFTVLSMKTIQERVSAILTGFTLFLGVIAAVSLIVGAVGIANTMFTAVLERTREIGIMKALGAKNSDILAIFLFNSGLVGLVGGLIGIIFGVSIALLIPKAGVSFSGGEALSTSISLGLLIFTLIFSIVLGMISGIIPAYRASKLKPVDALRFE